MQLSVIIILFVHLIKISVQIITCGNKMYSIYSSDDNAVCYWTKESDDLELLEKRQPPKSIYFIDTSCKGGLNAREACSIEAAAKVNPARKVNVLFTGPVRKVCLKHEPLLSLQSYKNIHLRRIYVDEYSQNTGFKKRLTSDIINEGPYPNLYALDLLKFITLYKFDGVYMDLDVLATRPFDDLPKSKNWVAIEDHGQKTLSTAIFAASSDTNGRQLINSILIVLYTGSSSSDWNFETFNVIVAALEKLHGPIPFNKTKSGYSFTHHGFVIYASIFFSPIPGERSNDYFESKHDIKNLTKSFTQQLCNGMTFENPITRNSTYAKLMSEFCPNVYSYLVSQNFKEKIL